VVVENTSSGDDGGCSVAAPGGPRPGALAALGLALLGVARRRRR
jgi:MYXO-CTERM domain-containing protein